MNNKHHLHLADAEVSSLTALVSSGHLPARVFRRATALFELARGKSLAEGSHDAQHDLPKRRRVASLGDRFLQLLDLRS